jgi:hypothetical protein
LNRRTVVALSTCPLSGMDTNDLLANLAWRSIRDWRRWGRAVSGASVDADLRSWSEDRRDFGGVGGGGCGLAQLDLQSIGAKARPRSIVSKRTAPIGSYCPYDFAAAEGKQYILLREARVTAQAASANIG